VSVYFWHREAHQHRFLWPVYNPNCILFRILDSTEVLRRVTCQTWRYTKLWTVWTTVVQRNGHVSRIQR